MDEIKERKKQNCAKGPATGKEKRGSLPDGRWKREWGKEDAGQKIQSEGGCRCLKRKKGWSPSATLIKKGEKTTYNTLGWGEGAFPKRYWMTGKGGGGDGNHEEETATDYRQLKAGGRQWDK